jgi:hypothetical protein
MAIPAPEPAPKAGDPKASKIVKAPESVSHATNGQKNKAQGAAAPAAVKAETVAGPAQKSGSKKTP